MSSQSLYALSFLRIADSFMLLSFDRHSRLTRQSAPFIYRVSSINTYVFKYSDGFSAGGTNLLFENNHIENGDDCLTVGNGAKNITFRWLRFYSTSTGIMVLTWCCVGTHTVPEAMAFPLALWALEGRLRMFRMCCMSVVLTHLGTYPYYFSLA